MTAQDWAEERAERVHKEMNDYEPGHPQPCSDCRIIAAALIEAEGRGREPDQQWEPLYNRAYKNWRDAEDRVEQARAEGERGGREKALEEAAQICEHAATRVAEFKLKKDHWETPEDLHGQEFACREMARRIRALRGKP